VSRRVTDPLRLREAAQAPRFDHGHDQGQRVTLRDPARGRWRIVEQALQGLVEPAKWLGGELVDLAGDGGLGAQSGNESRPSGSCAT
jgi:hypothetical protein